ncbi:MULTISPECIES: S-adenosylmethionine:tRNA ribosyltransferase-isomerase [unclassified Frankia]|uniref:S-adenosylmethionine:tRNA ribosyltransferase-isomerase n=1 Tax=unclassified Frankia TaxID=2632575 RepID=UPI002AD234A2|nr:MULTISPECIES: S-adenosylmethionine:tRNA ribosyltransferase-isomerase [unclassified Frankia]
MTERPVARTRFVLPAQASATMPPEARGLRRDGVRLLVADELGVRHARFADLTDFLEPGDLVVVNTSATLAAAVDGRRDGRRGVGRDGRTADPAVVVHFSTALDDGSWVVELRPSGPATGPVWDAVADEKVSLPAGASLTLVAPCSEAARVDGGVAGNRLWRAQVDVEGGVSAFLATHGRPITYSYVTGRWPLESYQTVFAHDPGSAEMPSAGRPFTTELVTSLIAAGISMAPVTLHTGVSSPQEGEPPSAEPFRVPPSTARLVNLTRTAGRRVVAVGTTVTRALETVARPDGTVRAGQGWTDLVLGPERPARVVSGLVTGWHAPGASHLLLLEAVAGADLVGRAYQEAVGERYLWHEFGDSALLLPRRHRPLSSAEDSGENMAPVTDQWV